MPRSFPGSPSAGGTGAPEAVSDPQEQRGPVPRSRAPHAGGAQYPAAPGDGSVAPSAPLTARPLPAGNVSLGRVPTFFLAVCGVRLSVQPVRGGGAGGVAAGRMPQPGSWEILGLVGQDSDPRPGVRAAWRDGGMRAVAR